MRTSLNEIRQIEKALQSELTPEDALVFEAKSLINPSLRINIFWQKRIYELLRYYHRKKLKERAEQIHQKIFSDPSKSSFRKNILQLFS
jgi:hypothetical protein